MERIKVSWRDSVAHQVQSAVSGLAIDEEFSPIDVRTSVSNHNVPSVLSKMNCTKKLERGRYKKTFDPRDHLTNPNPQPIPEVCAECYFTQRNTSGPLRSGCIILADYRMKRPL